MCHQYWPTSDDAVQYGSITIVMKGETECTGYVLREMTVTKVSFDIIKDVCIIKDTWTELLTLWFRIHRKREQ
jgi:hypothetical protein